MRSGYTTATSKAGILILHTYYLAVGSPTENYLHRHEDALWSWYGQLYIILPFFPNFNYILTILPVCVENKERFACLSTCFQFFQSLKGRDFQ